MRYIPHTEDDIRRMLQAVGVDSLERLFESIPESVRKASGLDLPEPLDEYSLTALLTRMAETNSHACGLTSFLGAGVYNHHVPAAVDHVLLRGDFFTAYTPYQPEISQGTLQAIYEFQTMICELTGMEVANASLYDGASALAEGVLMAQRLNKRNRRVLLARSIHPEYRQTTQTYVQHSDLELIEVPFGPDGRIDMQELERLAGEPFAAIAVQQPNALGVIERLDQIQPLVHDKGSLIVCVNEPLSLGMLKPPGELGADIVLGEGAGAGIAPGFGGPHLGFFAVNKKQVRSMPGRLCGATTDAKGNRGFVLTLSTREQHIRREKATSNICTNQALCALAMTVYLSLLGPQGLAGLARLNHYKAEYAKRTLAGVPGVELPLKAPTFNEFVLRPGKSIERVRKALLDAGILAGFPLAQWYPEMSDCLLLAVTENIPAEEIDNYARLLQGL